MTASATMAHYALEDESLREAMKLVETYEPFHALPHDLPREGVVIGFLRRIGQGKKGITRGEGLNLLRGDLIGHLADLRRRIFSADAERLGAPRIAVLLHLAHVLTVQRVVAWDELWNDLSRGAFDDAANHLLLSEWPAHYGTDLERRRAVVLQQILRTGVLPRKAGGFA